MDTCLEQVCHRTALVSPSDSPCGRSGCNNRGAVAFDHDDVAPQAMMLADVVTGAEFPESGAAVEGSAMDGGTEGTLLDMAMSSSVGLD